MVTRCMGLFAVCFLERQCHFQFGIARIRFLEPLQAFAQQAGLGFEALRSDLCGAQFAL